MAEIINMPRLSDTMTEGVVATWLKKVGDKVDLLIVRDKHFKNITVTLRKLEVNADELYNRQNNLQPPG